MSYLKNKEPALFARFEKTRHLDMRLLEVYEDLETVARARQHGDPSSAARTAEIVDELMQELKERVEANESRLDPTERQIP